MLQGHVASHAAKRQFIAIAIFAVVANIVFQLLLDMVSVQLHSLFRGLIETIAVAVIVVPPSYYYYSRPFRLSIEERTRAERSLRKSEMHYRIVSELTTTFVFDLLIGEGGRVSLDFVSDNFYTFAGRPRDDARSFETLLSHIHPDDIGKLVENLQKVIVEPKSAEIECRAYVGDPPELRWLALYGKSEWDEAQGRVTAIYGAAKDITERKRAEENQGRVQRLLEVSQRLAHIGSWEYELSTGTLWWSDEMYRIAGLPLASPINRETVESFFPPDELSRSRKILSTLLVDDALYSTDYRVKRQDGRSIVIHNEGEMIRDDNGKAVRVLGTTQDITERKLAEESLRESEQITEGILNAIPAGVFWKNTDLAYLGCNTRFAKDAGFNDPSDILGKDDYEIGFPKEYADRYREIDRHVIEAGSAVLNVEDSRSRNGVKFTDLASIVPLRNLKGQISGVLGTYMDVTELRRTQEELRENEKRLQSSEAKYRKLIETAPEAIFVVENAKVIFFNNHALEMLAYSPEEMFGMPLEKINYFEDWENAERVYRARAAGNRLEKSITRNVTRDGRVIWVECVGERIEWEGKDAVLYFSSDITEKKRAESERVIVNQYLQQAQKLESLEVLAGGIAHDFNNMLMGIFGFTDLARSEAKDPNVAEYLSQAMDSMQRAKALTQQLLTFSKGGAPVRKMERVAPLIMETCRFTLHGSNLKGFFDVEGDLWNCNVDKNQIGQVIQNLMINAIQAMPMGGVIKVRAKNVTLAPREHPTLPGGAYVCISIRDQGIGISQEMIPRIFDPFFTTKSEGHGLGLAISHSVMVRHGGAISVESELGKGTTFHIYLPACKECQPHDGENHEIRHAGEGVVLVMDDDEAIRTLLSKMLESLGYSTVCKPDGTSAIDFFKKAAIDGNRISAVLLDLTIPGGMGGKEVAVELRKLNREIPIFVSSGYAEDPVMAHPRDYGITASLSKPFRKIELMEMLEKHITKRG